MLKIIGTRILIKPDPTEEVTEGGILLPDIAQKKPLRGTVAAVSPDCDELKVGDKVIYAKYGGNFITLDDDEYLLVDIDSVYATIED